MLRKFVFSPFGTFLGLRKWWLSGKPSEFVEEERELVMSNRFANISVKGLAHYGQLINSGGWHEFDFYSGNMAKYGQETPPNLDLKTITKMPIAMIVGKEDWLAPPDDAKLMAD